MRQISFVCFVQCRTTLARIEKHEKEALRNSVLTVCATVPTFCPTVKSENAQQESQQILSTNAAVKGLRTHTQNLLFVEKENK